MDKQAQLLLDELGQSLVAEVRDSAIAYIQSVISGQLRDEVSRRLHQEYKASETQREVVTERFALAAVDACFARMLNYLDIHKIPIPPLTGTGTSVDVRQLSDGLVGELYGEHGWIARFSKFPPLDKPEK